MIWGLQRRLMLLLLLPLGLVGLVSFWLHYQSAGTAALQQDQQLLRLVPLLADSVVVTHSADAAPPALAPGDAPGLALLLAPPVDEFLKDREGFAAYAIREASGRHVLGDAWLPTVLPSTDGAEFLSVVEGGITYRVAAQRYDIAAGDLIVMLADGSDARQHWLDNLLVRGSYATSFKAPDMHYVFSERSGSFGTVTDFELCRQNGIAPSACGAAGAPVTRLPPATAEGMDRLEHHAAEALVLAALPDVAPAHLAVALQTPGREVLALTMIFSANRFPPKL